MLKKVLPFVVLAAFIGGPVMAPAMAGDDAAKKCEKIKDAKAKAECLKKAGVKK